MGAVSRSRGLAGGYRLAITRGMNLPTISLEQLGAVTGGEGEAENNVDYSQQGNWISQSTAAMGANGFGSKFNNAGLNGVRNPDMTNVIKFPGR